MRKHELTTDYHDYFGELRWSETMPDEAHFDEWQPALSTILGEGCLARRVLTRLGKDWHGDRLKEAMAVLGRCLADGVMFHASS